MALSIIKQVEQKIKGLPKGKVFFVADFSGIGSDEAIRQSLQRLMKKELIIRLSKGIYYYPKKGKLFNDIIYPTAEQIAKAIAKRDKARIIPTGSYAQYKLGLSTQIPMNVIYLTDGSARKISVGNQDITFKKASPRNLIVEHKLSNLIIQALKELKEKDLNAEIKEKIKRIIIKSGEKDEVKKTIKNAPARIKNTVLKIIKEIEDDELA